jgi:hypothetical protein
MSSKRRNGDSCTLLLSGIALGFALVTLAPGNASAVDRLIETKVAYLDPGTGSMILQAIVASIAGVAVAVTSYRRKIAAFFRRRSQDSEKSASAPGDE